MGVELPEETIAAVLEEADRVLARYVAPTGRLEFDSPAHIVRATKAEGLTQRPGTPTRRSATLGP